MSVSLHHAAVPAFLQVLRPVAGLIEKGRAHCSAHGLPDTAVTEARLAPDMWPFAKQVMAAIQHSAGAVAGVKQGETGPDLTPPPTTFDELDAAVAAAIAALEAEVAGELDAIAGNDTCFRFGERVMPFTVEDYLLTFAMPNFYFHASMAYAVLRNLGLEVGKRDFLGAPRMKA